MATTDYPATFRDRATLTWSGTSAKTTDVWVQGRNQGWFIRFRLWLAGKIAPPTVFASTSWGADER